MRALKEAAADEAVSEVSEAVSEVAAAEMAPSAGAGAAGATALPGGGSPVGPAGVGASAAAEFRHDDVPDKFPVALEYAALLSHLGLETLSQQHITIT